MDFIIALALITFASYLIKYAADQFEPAADYLGRNMPPGVKGATINAIGSSMPELLTGIAFVFTISSLNVAEGFLSAIAVTAGSAVFNIAIIPALVILFALAKNKDTHITVSKHTIIRDGAFLLSAELLLIVLLGLPVLSIWTALMLIGTYAAYFGYLMWQNYRHEKHDEEIAVVVFDEGDGLLDDEDEDEEVQPSILKQFLTFDVINLYFKGRDFDTKMAWSVLAFSIGLLGISCHLLAESVVMAADALSVPVYITSVIFAAAATSVPDTVLSVKDALKGEYDDAVANAVGSNIFDITICAGVPLLLYTALFGSIDFNLSDAMEAQVQLLRIVLLGVSAAVIGMFLMGREIGKTKAVIMLGMYVAWITWIIVTAIS